jgi:hypothetical protein
VKLMRSVLAFVLFTAVAGMAAAQPTVFLVRHAERADAGMSGAGSMQTAAPLAKALGIEAITVPANTPGTLLEALKTAGGNVLVVGHSNTVPDLLRGLGVTAVKIDDKEFDNLFVVTMGAKPTMVRLRFQ